MMNSVRMRDVVTSKGWPQQAPGERTDRVDF